MSKVKRVRFSSQRNAESFAERTGGEFIDNRNNESRKSDFIVRLSPEQQNSRDDDSYDRWYEEASMDGSLAYNNSADDL